MSGDMVAELTLRLQNEMSGGIEAIREEFASLDGTLGGLRDVLAQLTAAMGSMTGPAALEEGMASVTAGADEALASVTGIGAALDTDIQKADDLAAALAKAGAGGDAAAAAGAAGGGGGGGGPAPVSGGDGGDGDEPASKKHGGVGNWIMDAFALGAGVEGEKSYAEYQDLAMQAAIIEGYHGKAALKEAKKIMSESYDQANLSRGNADDIELAYFQLVKQGLPKALVNQMMGPLTEAATTYDFPAAQMTNPLYHLYDQLNIPADQMTQALGMLGAASHLGLFSMGDFASDLPKILTRFGILHETGLPAEATAAAALEFVRKGTGDSSTAATDLQDAMQYMTSPIAARFFDRSQRSKDLLGGSILDLLSEYHVQPLDLPKYFDAEQAKGVDPLNAMVDYLHSIGLDKMTKDLQAGKSYGSSEYGSDEAFILGSLLHNTEASTAFAALVNNYGDFTTDQKNLKKVDPNFLDEQFQTKTLGDSGGLAILGNEFTQFKRWYGRNLIDLHPGGMGDAPSQASLDAAHPGASAFNVPINLTVNVDKSGNVTASAAHVPPGVSVKVNQGPVLVHY